MIEVDTIKYVILFVLSTGIIGFDYFAYRSLKKEFNKKVAELWKSIGTLTTLEDQSYKLIQQLCLKTGVVPPTLPEKKDEHTDKHS